MKEWLTVTIKGKQATEVLRLAALEEMDPGDMLLKLFRKGIETARQKARVSGSGDNQRAKRIES